MKTDLHVCMHFLNTRDFGKLQGDDGCANESQNLKTCRVAGKRQPLGLRMRNDSFYDDYLHRGDMEPAGNGQLVETPLSAMSYYDYGAHVRVVPGDPDNLGPGQYAFVAHHAKYTNYVQELRPSPVVPFIHGFTMPTCSKDPKINACFKQVVLRPSTV